MYDQMDLAAAADWGERRGGEGEEEGGGEGGGGGGGVVTETGNISKGVKGCMGWLRLVGSFQSYVSFAEYRLFYRALLHKRPLILRGLLTEATP